MNLEVTLRRKIRPRRFEDELLLRDQSSKRRVKTASGGDLFSQNPCEPYVVRDIFYTYTIRTTNAVGFIDYEPFPTEVLAA